MSVIAAVSAGPGPVIAKGVDDEPMTGNQRDPQGRVGLLIAVLCAAYTVFHLVVMVFYPLETWTYRMIHLCGGLVIGFLTYSALTQTGDEPGASGGARHPLGLALTAVAVAGIGYGFLMVAIAWGAWWIAGAAQPPGFAFSTFGIPLTVGTLAAILSGWFFAPRARRVIPLVDIAMLSLIHI